jgi:hypothetical protein
VSRRALAGWLCLGLGVLGAGCNRGGTGPAFRLEQPSALTIFWSFTNRHPQQLWPYAAVANTAQDELVMFDAVDDNVVAAPILLRPLSVPIPTLRPALLASARFTPPGAPGEQPARPDLLVAVSAGSSELQLIRTWQDPAGATGPGLITTPDGNLDLGDQILAVTAAPSVDAAGNDVPDRVRVIAALAGGQIAVVEYQWAGDPATNLATIAAVGAPTFQTVGFDGLSLAVDPRDPKFVYAATLDPIGSSGVFGVAQLDMRGANGSWPLRAIDAHAPTRLVAAFTLRERMLNAAGAYDQYTSIGAPADNLAAFQPTRVSRVYALRDSGACGPQFKEECGIAVLDPVAGDVLEDPWHLGASPKRFLPPITSASTPLAMIVGPPAINPPDSDNARAVGDTTPAELMLIEATTPPRLTTGVLLLPSRDGKSYFADLARWETPSGNYELATTNNGIGVSSFTISTTTLPRIGFYEPPFVTEANAANGNPSNGNPASLNASSTAGTFFQLTPGFTPSDQWTVTFQGYLPDFTASRVATVESLGGDPQGTAPLTFRIALQATPPGASAPTQIVNVYDPALGLHVGDIVEFWTDARPGSDTPKCPDTTQNPDIPTAPIEGKITEITRPDLNHPGGSLVVVKGDCVPFARGVQTKCEFDDRGPWNPIPNADCWNKLSNAPRQVRIRSGTGVPGSEEFVVVGAAFGYAGRAASSATKPATFPTFTVDNANEAQLVAACPLIPYPADPTTVPVCDGACRATCEQAWIARRARRIHLTAVQCYHSPGDTSAIPFCQTYFPQFFVKKGDEGNPFPPGEGPALAFSLGWEQVNDTITKLLVRDTHVAFTTRSGWTPSARFGGGGNSGPATLPTGGSYFDRTQDLTWNHQGERYRFFVPHVGNLVLDLTPSQNNGSTRVLR